MAREGDVDEMGTTLLRLAARLRSGDLDPDELEFLASALERIGNAKNPKSEAARALLLVRSSGKTTLADGKTKAIERAKRVRSLILGGKKREEAIATVAETEGVDDTQIRKAWDKYREALQEIE